MNASPNTPSKTILGIDPGTLLMGYGIVEQVGSQLLYKQMGVLDLRKEKDPLIKLRRIHQEIVSLIETYCPDAVSIESPFYGKNPQSLIKLGRAQGVAIAAAMNLGIDVYEYAPLKIKQAITGNGNASKEQVCSMLFTLLHLKGDKPRFFDATDALGAAVCHALQHHFEAENADISRNKTNTKSILGHKKKSSSWENFLSQNPSRIAK